MSLTLYYHPLASFCHKVLIALYESGTSFTSEIVDFGNAEASAHFLEMWPVGKIPVLNDSGRGVTVPETSIIIDYLETHYPGPRPLLPPEPAEQLDARLWDRFFDLYIHVPMQKIVTDLLRPKSNRDPYGVAEARSLLQTAYGMADRRLQQRRHPAGDGRTLADCAAAPALFYATIAEPIPDSCPHLANYLRRLMEWPSYVRVLREAKPYFHLYPLNNQMPAELRAAIDG